MTDEQDIYKCMLYDSFWKRPTTSNHAHSN